MIASVNCSSLGVLFVSPLIVSILPSKASSGLITCRAPKLKRDARIAKRIGAVSYNSYSSLTTDSTIGVVGVFDDRTTDDRQEPQATCALPCLSHNASKGKNRASRTSPKCRHYLTSALFFFLGLGA